MCYTLILYELFRLTHLYLSETFYQADKMYQTNKGVLDGIIHTTRLFLV
jgi:hypothetical protein